MKTPPENLERLINWIWSALATGANDRHSGYHLGTLASVGQDGRPRSRVVVVRDVDASKGEVLFHTDRRSGKIGELENSPTVSWLWYDPEQRVQIRGSGLATIHIGNDLAHERWNASRLASRRCYLAEEAPGAKSEGPTSGLSAELEARCPTRDESEAGFHHFAVVATVLDELEYLWLASRGHRRARFVRQDWRWEGVWLIP